MESANLILQEARARIIWGEPSASVRSSLISNGFSDREADAKLREFILERNAAIRKTGIKKILIGATILFGVGVYFYFRLKDDSFGMTYRSRRGLAVIVLTGLFGFWKFLSGIFYLVWPQSENQSISEISE